MAEEPQPRRYGTVREWQNGRWFMYLTIWDEIDEQSRSHQEIEIHHNTNELVLYTTDKTMFEDVKAKFFNNPERFK